MILDYAKLRRVFTLMKDLASVVTLRLLLKTLIQNKMVLLASNSLKLAGLAVNLQKILPIFIFIYNFVKIIIVKILRGYSYETT